MCDELEQIGSIPKLSVRGRAIFSTDAPEVVVPFVPPTFMDDLAVPLSADSSMQLLADIEVACSVLVEVARWFGMEINLLAGKTEAVVLLAGAGAVEARDFLGAAEVHGYDGAPVLPLSSGGGIRVVTSYKHRGVKVSHLN